MIQKSTTTGHATAGGGHGLGAHLLRGLVLVRGSLGGAGLYESMSQSRGKEGKGKSIGHGSKREREEK